MALLDTVDPDGLDDFSVVYTDRSLNHMSVQFQQVMNDLSTMLKEVYNADAVVIVPGGGTYGMEAVARQFGQNADVLIIRNGWFSYRWTQILERGGFGAGSTVMKAQRLNDAPQAAFAPAAIDDVVSQIRKTKPSVVFAPHVETASGIILPDDYLTELSAAAHEVGALLVLDCVASGAAWVDMKACGIDVLISAPQKGWTASPAAGLVMLSERAIARMQTTESDSFALNLKQWHEIMQAYENGGHAYHATVATDTLRVLRDAIKETRAYGFEKLRKAQWQLGLGVRRMLAEKGIKSVAAEGFGAPGVVVSYTDDLGVQNGSKFIPTGLQIAAGVPLMCDEPEGFMTFRLGLFGLDKLYDVDATIARLRAKLEQVI